MSTIEDPSCSECGLLNCYRHGEKFPDFCLTEAVDPARVESTIESYRGDGLDGKLYQAAAEVEGLYYGKLTRVEETLVFARRIGASRVGIATCVGLIEETRIFAKFLRQGGMTVYTVLCKVGSVDKTDVAIAEELKVRPGKREACCNPILQARLLNDQKTDLNVIVGLCVGHDSLFIRYSEAPVTTLIVKDRVLGHNPAVALYTAKTYCSRLFDEERIKGL
ncbi:DUF1847 domain-containing protein [Telmatospirillum sp.]|uniref:DUF1847 domain-containing protein n=1 Tax=Telmatospirillum sp. TaxID=2079197 RepID=UPI002846C80F|nr:DUF1847 domain-containing protein [Telmatospirillum sp.]MDR3436011.1 DUF1847 domain-containing protein [Telmatospirillum sp.]